MSVIDDWIQKSPCIYTQWNITQPSKNNEILPFAMMWMELECIMLREIRQSEKDIYDFTHVEVKKQNT